MEEAQLMQGCGAMDLDTRGWEDQFDARDRRPILPVNYLGRLARCGYRWRRYLHRQQQRPLANWAEVATPILPAPIVQLVGIDAVRQRNPCDRRASGHRFLHALTFVLDRIAASGALRGTHYTKRIAHENTCTSQKIHGHVS